MRGERYLKTYSPINPGQTTKQAKQSKELNLN